MKYSAFIPPDISYYLNAFSKERYPSCFSDYCRAAKQELDAVAQMDSPVHQAEQLVVWMDSQVNGLLKKRKRLEQQLLLMEYTVPAAIRCEQRPFAEALQVAWNTAHPDFSFGLATYEELYAGFNMMFLGVKIEREDRQ